MATSGRLHENAAFGVIFDMDGVLIDSADAHWQSWRLLAEEHGCTVSEAQFAATFGRQNRDLIPVLFGPVTEDLLHRLSDRKEAIYRDLIRARPPIVEGAAELVRGLHRAGALLAVGSSGPRANIALVLEAMDVSDVVRVVVSADDVTRGKPDPQVFQLACDRLALPPSRCVVVEDAPAGVAAARAAGTRCVAVMMHHPRESLAGADDFVEELANLTVDRLRGLVLR